MRRQIINWKRPLNPVRAQARAVIKDFGRNVRARRVAAGLRQTDLARVCHVGARPSARLSGATATLRWKRSHS